MPCDSTLVWVTSLVLALASSNTKEMQVSDDLFFVIFKQLAAPLCVTFPLTLCSGVLLPHHQLQPAAVQLR